MKDERQSDQDKADARGRECRPGQRGQECHAGPRTQAQAARGPRAGLVAQVPGERASEVRAEQSTC